MTLNFSPRSIFPTTSSPTTNDDFASVIRDSSSEGFSKPYGIDCGISDPSVMEDLEIGPDVHEVVGDGRSYDLFEGLNYLCNRALLLSTESLAFDACVGDSSSEPSMYETRDESLLNVLDVGESSSSSVAEEAQVHQAEEVGGNAEKSCHGRDVAVPHDGLFFSLRYLGVQDLFSVERVCKSMRSAVQTDSLLWRCIYIDPPLSKRITNDILLRLSERAEGRLQCLSLVECPNITGDGLRYVLESNPRLTKLSVPGCARLTVKSLINNLKDLRSPLRIQQLKLGDSYGVTHEHFEELKLLLGVDQLQQPKSRKPRFYHSDLSSLSCEDGSAIDIEICPIPGCGKLRVIYDCPSESCQGKESHQLCRACKMCIARCVQCGRCINDDKYMETFSLDYLCLGCWKHLPQCKESQEEN